MKPWIPLQIDWRNKSPQIGTLMHNIIFDGFLPSAITTAGEAILAAPIRLRTFYRSAPGSDDIFEGKAESVNTIVYSNDDETFSFGVQQRIENLVQNVRVKVSEDGFMWFDMALMSFWQEENHWDGSNDPDQNAPRITSMKLEIPLMAGIAELSHYWTSDGGASNNAPIGSEALMLPFKGITWIGNEISGLTLYLETPENITSPDEKGLITVQRDGEAVVLTLNMLTDTPDCWKNARDTWFAPLNPLTFSFGLQPTPVKPFEWKDGYRRVYHSGYTPVVSRGDSGLEEFVKKIADNGVRWIVLHEDWSIIQNYGLPADEELFLRVVERFHSRGIKVSVYFGYEFASNAPDWFEKRDEYALMQSGSRRVGGWQRLPFQRAYMVCYKGGYADAVLERMKYAFENYHIDGVYLDGTLEPWICENTLHGCGCHRDGKLTGTYPIKELRDFMRRIKTLVDSYGGYIEAHQSSCLIPSNLAYTNSYWDGEHIMRNVSSDMTGYLRTAVVRSEFTGFNVGVPSLFLGSGDEIQCRSYVLMYGVSMKMAISGENGTFSRYVIDTLEEFGDTEATFYAFWNDKCPIKPLTEDVIASVWVRSDGNMLVAALNMGSDTVDAEIDMGEKTLHLTLQPMRAKFKRTYRSSR